MGDGQPDGKNTAFTGAGAGDCETAVMRFYNMLANRQANTAAAPGTGARFIYSVKPLKNVALLLGRQADAGVFDSNQYTVFSVQWAVFRLIIEQ